MLTRMATKRLSIATKFNLMTILLMLFLSTGIGIFVSRHETDKYYKQISENGKTLTSMVAGSSEYAIYTENQQDLMQILNNLNSVEDIAYAVILNKEKRILGEKIFLPAVPIPPLTQNKNTLSEKGIIVEDLIINANRDRYFNIVSPVVSTPGVETLELLAGEAQQPNVIGYIQLGLSQEGLRKQIRELYITITLFTSIFIAIGLALTVLLTRKIIFPLEELSASAQEVAQGKLEHHLKVTTNDEIYDLAQSFNHMLDNLQIYRKQVEERTAELMTANIHMQNEIAERKQAEEELRVSKERYALAAQGANDGLWDWEFKTNEIYFSPRWKTMLGYTEGDIGNSLDEWLKRVDSQDREQLQLALSAHINGLSEHFEKEYRILHKDGTYRWMLSRGLMVRDESGKPYRMAGSQTDITERKVAEAQLLHDAFHDALTGLPNRALFTDRLTHAFDRSKRQGISTLGVMFCDLDRFKIVNDSMGHLMGDQLLIEVGHRIEECIRKGDTIARLGGDEFAILLTDLKDIDVAKQIAERIFKKMQTLFHIGGQEVFVNTSIGIAAGSEDCRQPEELLGNADIALYQAKAHGKGRYEIFDTGMRTSLLTRMQIETDLRGSIERHEFQLHYQPIISVQTGEVFGFEALLRWQHPKRGIIPPMEFIPVIEETGLIVPIGRWVLNEACRQIRAWIDRFPQNPPLMVSVNISCKQLTPSIVTDIRHILDETNLQGSRLTLEITESAIMENPELIYPLLLGLKEMNICLSIDDFGTGYSSLSYLQRLPINILKIDRSFINALGVKDESTEIIRTIITLAGSLNMDVIAEGVETPEQFENLKSLQCQYAQGYLFAKPLDQKAAETYLAGKLSDKQTGH